MGNECTCCRRGREPPVERGGQPHSHSNTGRWGLPHFHPFHISVRLHAPLSFLLILATSTYSNWNGAMQVFLGKKNHALLPTSVGRTSDTWLCPAVEIFIKMNSGWSGSVAWEQTTGKAEWNQTTCSSSSPVLLWSIRSWFIKYEIDDTLISSMNLQSKHAQFALSDTHQAVNSLATSQQTPCLLPSIKLSETAIIYSESIFGKNPKHAVSVWVLDPTINYQDSYF